jgi:hypothetical protein
MGKVYVNQDSLRIRLTTSVDITGATSLQIRYKKPSGSTSQVTATSEDDADGIIYYDLPQGSTLLDEAGDWLFWAYVTFSDNRSAPGEPARVHVYEAGT